MNGTGSLNLPSRFSLSASWRIAAIGSMPRWLEFSQPFSNAKVFDTFVRTFVRLWPAGITTLTAAKNEK